MTHPSDIEPIIKKLFDSFISEAHPPQYITIGLNCLRELIERVPYLIGKEYINVDELKNYKEFKNKSVANAARAIINCIKEINSNVLGIYDKDEDKDIYFGQAKVNDSLDGIELLKKLENLPKEYKMEQEEILDDTQVKKLRILKMKYSAEKNTK